MRLTLSVMFGTTLLLGSIAPSIADDMYCGDQIISGGQINGMSKGQVIELCGKPDWEDYGDLFYKKDQSTYHLHFNGDDVLDSVSEEQQQ